MIIRPWFCVFHLCQYHTFLSHWLWSAWTAAVFLKYSSCIIGIHYSWVLQSAYELVTQQHSVLKRASIERLDLNSTRAAVRGHWNMENTSRGSRCMFAYITSPAEALRRKNPMYATQMQRDSLRTDLVTVAWLPPSHDFMCTGVKVTELHTLKC